MVDGRRGVSTGSGSDRDWSASVRACMSIVKRQAATGTVALQSIRPGRYCSRYLPHQQSRPIADDVLHVRLRLAAGELLQSNPESIVSAIRQTLTVIKRVAIVVGIAIAFSLGLMGAIYLSLRSSETRVPDIVGKDRTAAENTISESGNKRQRKLERNSGAHKFQHHSGEPRGQQLKRRAAASGARSNAIVFDHD